MNYPTIDDWKKAYGAAPSGAMGDGAASEDFATPQPRPFTPEQLARGVRRHGPNDIAFHALGRLFPGERGGG